MCRKLRKCCHERNASTAKTVASPTQKSETELHIQCPSPNTANWTVQYSRTKRLLIATHAKQGLDVTCQKVTRHWWYNAEGLGKLNATDCQSKELKLVVTGVDALGKCRHMPNRILGGLQSNDVVPTYVGNCISDMYIYSALWESSDPYVPFST